jgi:Co/Zn/Cd efflux system component
MTWLGLLMVLIGNILITYGVWQWSPPLAMVVLGFWFLWLASAMFRRANTTEFEKKVQNKKVH